MKRTVFILLLALCVCLLAACGAQDALQSITGQAAQPTAAPAPEQTAEDSGTDLILPGQPGYSDDSGTDTAPSAGGFADLTADQCVEDDWPTAGVLPRIVLDCPGAEQINSQLQDTFAPIADDPACQGLHYECFKGAGHVLSLLMVERWPNDCTYYTPFNLDLATGKALSGAELLEVLEVNTDGLANLEQAVMSEEFTHQFGTAEEQTDGDFYQQQYARTTSPDNTDTDRVWLGGDGQLYFVGRIYGLAGAEFYEYPLGSTLFFQ